MRKGEDQDDKGEIEDNNVGTAACPVRQELLLQNC